MIWQRIGVGIATYFLVGLPLYLITDGWAGCGLVGLAAGIFAGVRWRRSEPKPTPRYWRVDTSDRDTGPTDDDADRSP